MSTLICPTCGRQVTTSDESGPPAICPACGTSLLASDQTPPAPAAGSASATRDDSDTRPIPFDEFTTRPVPPAPPAPSARDEGTPIARGATRDLPASALPKPPSGDGRRAGSGLARGVGIAAMLALLVVIIIGAALVVNGDLPFLQQTAATPTATATPSIPTATPATITYTRAGLYKITYPNGWLTTEQNNPPNRYSVAIVNSKGGATVSITVQQTQELVDPATNDLNYLTGLAAPTNTKPQNVSKPQAITLAGQTWTEESADVSILTSNNGVKTIQYAHAVVMSVNFGGSIYTIVRLAPWPDQAGAATAFAAAEQASFQPMLATFTFLS